MIDLASSIKTKIRFFNLIGLSIGNNFDSLYNLSDDAIEFQILDRLLFMRFLNLTLGDRVPDSKTIWLFRDQLTKANLI